MSSSTSASSSSAATSAAAKKGRKTVAAPPAPVAAAAPVAASPAASKSSSKAASSSSPVAAKISHVETPAVAASTSTTTATISTPAVAESVNVVTEFNSLVEQVNVLRATLGSVFSSMKKLEKQIPRELKKAQKGRRRKAVATEGGEEKPKKDTVFTKPTPITDALCTFLGVPKGTLLSRSEVTTRVCRYAKENSLMVKQVIKADAPMRKLLALTEKDELKILNLQRYLKPHYIKTTPAVAPATA